MKNFKNIYVIWAVASILALISSCVYYYIDQEGCAYCERRDIHFITEPMCNGDDAKKREWIDSIQVQGQRFGQLWHCEIR